MDSFFDYGRTFTGDDGISYGVFLNQPSFDMSEGNYDLWEIDAEHEYRADKIANAFYNNPSVSWIIDEANYFINGFIEYKKGVVLKIPTIEYLNSIGIYP